MKTQSWTVVRFPNGSWSYGGKPSDPDYSQCEIFVVEASTPEAAKKQAQARHAAAIRKSEREAAKQLQGKSHPTIG